MTFEQADASGIHLVATIDSLWHSGHAVEGVVQRERDRCVEVAVQAGASEAVVSAIKSLGGIGPQTFDFTASLKSEAL